MAKPKILLLDPDVRNRSILEISLKKSGFTVTCGGGAVEGMQIIDTFSPDLIISEISLEDNDGFWLCERLAEKYSGSRIPFIFLTKHKRVEDKIRGLELGVEDYLVKPIYLREVVARVKILIGKKEQVQKQEAAKPSGPLFQGDLEEMGVVDLLQTLELGNKTGIIQISTVRLTAQIFIQGGKVVHAVVGSFVGERAIYKIMQWTEGTFRIDFKKTLQVQQTITVSTQGLIMEGVRRIDEIERVKEQLPSFDTRMVIDSQIILEEHPDRFPAKIENILAEFDGKKSIETVVENLPYDELESLEVIGKLYFQGFLVEVPLDQQDQEFEGNASADASMRESSMFGTIGTIDLDHIELGDSTSIEGIKSKVFPSLDESVKVTSRKAPVFDSLPGFDLAPPSERVVVSPARRRSATLSVSSGISSPISSKRSRKIVTNLEPELPLAPPVVRATAPPGEMAPPSAMAPPLSPGDRIVAEGKVVLPEPVEAIHAESGREQPVKSPELFSEIVHAEGDKSKHLLRRRVREPREPVRRIPAVSNGSVEVGNVIAVSSEPLQQPEPAREAARLPVEQHSSNRPWLIFAGVIVLLFGSAAGFILYKKSIKTAPQLLESAIIAYERHDYEEASKAALASLSLDSSRVRTRILLAEIALSQGNLQEAINQYRTVVATEPSLYDERLTYSKLIYRQNEEGSPERALNEVDRLLLDVSPLRERQLYIDAQLFKLQLLVLLKHPAEGRVALTQLESVDPANPEIARYRTLIDGAAPKTAESKEKKAQPVVAPILAPVVKPSVREVQREPAKEEKTGPSQAELNRKMAAESYSKGLALYRKGYLKSSERELLAALTLDPGNSDILIDLGRIYSELGQDRLALQHFVKAAKLDPKNPRSYINLGSVYMLMGDTADAIKAYETYMRLVPPDSQESDEVKRILAKLKG